MPSANCPAPIYLAECRFGRHGNAFRETDRDSNSRSEILTLIASSEIDVIKVIEIDEVAGTCRDVTEDIMSEAETMVREAA
jgi:hypothetical protein